MLFTINSALAPMPCPCAIQLGSAYESHVAPAASSQTELNVPSRLMMYEEAVSRTTRLAYDLPSSLMSGLKNKKVAAAAKKLDAKLIALAVHATGADV
jgi:hypothetical protein